jgi:hypothetical protein
VDSLYLLYIQLELFCVLRGNNWVPKLNGPLSVVLKIEVLLGQGNFWMKNLTSVFSQIKNRAGVFLHFAVFKDFSNVQVNSIKGSGSRREGQDPDLNSKCFFTVKKSRRGLPAICGFLHLFVLFSQQFQHRGIRI